MVRGTVRMLAHRTAAEYIRFDPPDALDAG
jgi:hypothetical protein